MCETFPEPKYLKKRNTDKTRFFKILLGLTIAILLVGITFVNAECTYLDDGLIIGFYSMADDCITDSSTNSYDGTLINSPTHTSDYCSFDNAQDDVVDIDVVYGKFNPANEFTICMDLQIDTISENLWVMAFSKATVSTDYYGMYIQGANDKSNSLAASSGQSSNALEYANAFTGNTSWINYCFYINNVGEIDDVWFDNVNIGNIATGQHNPSGWDKGAIGGLYYNNAYVNTWDGNIKNFMLFEGQLNQTDIENLNGCNPYGGAPSTPTITLDANVTNGTEYNGVDWIADRDLIFNATFTDADTDLVNWSLYVDGSIVDSGTEDNSTVGILTNHTIKSEGVWYNVTIEACLYNNNSICDDFPLFYESDIGYFNMSGSPTHTSMINHSAYGLLNVPDVPSQSKDVGVYKFVYNATAYNTNGVETSCGGYLTTNVGTEIPLFSWGFRQIIGGSQVATVNFGSTEQYYNMTINCTQNLRYGGQTPPVGSTGRYSIYLDGINPQIVDHNNFPNGTIFYKNYTNTAFSVNITAADTNLHFVNITILNSTGQAIFSHFNDSINFTTPYNYYKAFDLNNNATGQYTYIKSVADDHTKDKIHPDDYHVNYIDNGFDIDDLQVYGDTITSSLVYDDEVQQDRFKFKIKFEEDALEHSFYLEDSGSVIYLPNSAYMGHFILMKNLRWLDLMSPDVKSVDVVDLGNNRFYITCHLTHAMDKVEFESIGDLNYVEEISQFNISDSFYLYAIDSVAATSISDFTVQVKNTTGTLLQTLTSSGGVAVFNQTSGEYNFTYSATNYISSSVLLNVTGGGTHTQSMTSGNSLYLFVYDEDTDLLIDWKNVTIEVVNYENASTRYNTSTGSAFVSGFAEGDYEIRYYADDYAQRLYFTSITGSDTQNISLFLLNESIGTIKLIEVVDQNDEKIGNVTISMLRHFIDCNCFEVVEMAKSSEQGNTFMFTELYTASYKYYLSYAGVNRLMTDTFRLDTRTLYFKIDLQTSGLTNYWETFGVSTAIAVNQTTNIWDYSWTNAKSGVTQANLVVKRVDIYGETIISNQSQSSSSGSLSFNQTAYEDLAGEFIGEGYVTIGGEDTLLERISFAYKSAHETYGLSGVLLTLIILGVVASIGFYNPSVSIGMLIVGMVITSTMGFLAISVVWLIGTVIAGLVMIMSIEK